MKNNSVKRSGGIVIFIYFISVIMMACNQGTQKDSGITGSGDTTRINKEKIREFWDAYRSAQEFRTKHDFGHAREYYRKALDLNPVHEDALFNYGNACYELGRFGEAEDAWNRLIKVNPMNARAHYQLGNLFLRYDDPGYFNLNKSADEFNKARNLNRQVTGPLLHLGQISLIRNDLDEATRYFSSVAGTDPKGVEAYFQLGYISWLKKDPGKAAEYFRDAVGISQPEVRADTIPIEGDTQEGKSLKRPANQSIFYEYYEGLNGLDVSSVSKEMNNRFRAQESFIEELRKLKGSDG